MKVVMSFMLWLHNILKLSIQLGFHVNVDVVFSVLKWLRLWCQCYGDMSHEGPPYVGRGHGNLAKLQKNCWLNLGEHSCSKGELVGLVRSEMGRMEKLCFYALCLCAIGVERCIGGLFLGYGTTSMVVCAMFS